MYDKVEINYNDFKEYLDYSNDKIVVYFFPYDTGYEDFTKMCVNSMWCNSYPNLRKSFVDYAAELNGVYVIRDLNFDTIYQFYYKEYYGLADIDNFVINVKMLIDDPEDTSDYDFIPPKYVLDFCEKIIKDYE